MSLIRSRNLLYIDVPYTRLRETEAAGATSLRVQNTDGLTTSWGVQIGETGHEQTEVLIGTNSNGTTVTCPTTRFEHPQDTPVYFIKYDQVVFQRSTDGTAGTATSMTNGTVTYQADDFFTVFDDTSGSSTYGYRTHFRNSVLAVNSTQSDWITFAGHDFYSLAKMRDRIKRKLWNAKYLEDQDIDDWLNECKDKMANKVTSANEDYAMGTVGVAFGTDGLGTITTPDFTFPRRMWINYDASNQYVSTKFGINDINPNQTYSETHPYHAWVTDNVFVVVPEGPGTAQVTFQRFGTTMVNDTDILPVPMRSYTDIFVDYCKSQAKSKDGKEAQAQVILSRVGTAIDNFALEIAPRDNTGPTMVSIVEPVSGESGWM